LPQIFVKDDETIYSSIIDSTFTNISLSRESLIDIKNSKLKDISNVQISNLESGAFTIQSSVIEHINTLNLTANKAWVEAFDSELTLIDEWDFEEWGDSSKLFGGALRLARTNSTILNTSFIDNKAEAGAGISIEWSFSSQWSNSFRNNTFKNNQATLKGGGIYYNLNRPSISHWSFENNSAQYGHDIASYPVKIVKSETSTNKIVLDEVVSGLEYETILEFRLVDYDEQLLILEDSSTVKITSNSLGASVKGTDFAKLNNGTSTFDNLIFKSEAGAQNVSFQYDSII